MHERMRDFQVRLIDHQVVIEQDVDIDRTVLIEARGGRYEVRDMLLASQVALDFLSGFKELTRSESGFTEDDAIEELIFRLESPRFGFDEGGLPKHRPYPLTNERYSFPDILRLIAQITS